MARKMHRRTNYLVKKNFQIKYTAVITTTILAVMLVSGIWIYVGMWSSIIENFSKFKVSENLETAKRIAGYEEARYGKGDFRLEKIFREAELLSAQEQDTLHNALKSVNRALLPKMAILVVIIFISGIFISHRIAGPMYHFEKSARAIRDGDLSVSFNIRKTDEMKDASLSLDEMVEALRADMKEMKVLAEKRDMTKISEILSKYKT
ncbi:MAG: methyl-accepting chemotaxis protein [Candidatus Omnitrophota bacterium]|nr:methyl-accepting chemotaxis protein [Candidatus Omnitrophota bacterium]